jgi:CubicO group peptidase (beta-lactamase class C family)
MKQTCYIPRPSQEPYVAFAYHYATNAGYKQADFLYTSIDPAVGVMTTGGDMARLMLAHLERRSKGLGRRGRELMHRVQFAEDDRLPWGMTCGFFEYSGHEERRLLHHGWAFGYQSELWLMPGRNLGLFVAMNKTGTLVLTLDELTNILFGEGTNPHKRLPPVPEKLDESSDLEALAGIYVYNRDFSRGKKAEECPGLRVTFLKEATALEISSSKGTDKPRRWRELAPLLFRSNEGNDLIAFRRSADGKSTYLAGFSGDGAYKRVEVNQP